MQCDLKVQLVNENAKVPTKAYNNDEFSDLGWDVYASEDTVVEPHTVGIVETGISIEVPNEFGMIIKDRSSKSMLYHVVGGVYDPSFRGKICVNILNYTNHEINIKRGDKFAQIVIIPNIRSNFQIVEHISTDTARGTNCLGSTDAKQLSDGNDVDKMMAQHILDVNKSYGGR